MPWIWPILKSAEIPGVGEVEFREVKKAGELIEQPKVLEVRSLESRRSSYLAVSDRDPSLARVGLRIELERRLRNLAAKNGIRDDQALKPLALNLKDAGILTEPSVKGIESILEAGNRAAHGAEVDAKVTDWAFQEGPRILSILDALLVSSTYEDREGSLNRAITIVEFEGPEFIEHCIDSLRPATREGTINLRVGYPSEKIRAGQTLVKLGALVSTGEESTRTGSVRLTITQMGNALLVHLLSDEVNLRPCTFYLGYVANHRLQPTRKSGVISWFF
jgi:hypothetical protein